MNNLLEMPTYKDCECGTRLQVLQVRLPVYLNELQVGVTDCKGCGNQHYIFIGDTDLVGEYAGLIEDRCRGRIMQRRRYSFN